MLFDGIKLVEGSEIKNLVVDTGPTFPDSPDMGELFYLTTAAGANNIGLYVYNGGWTRISLKGDDGSQILPNIVGLSPGTYKSVTINAQGLVTSASNPTTLSGYGITDAQPLDEDLTSIAALTGSSGFLKKTNINTWALDTNTYLIGNQNITISGDATGSGATSIALTLSSTGVGPGSYGSSSSIPEITVDSKGRVTSAQNRSIAVDATAVISGTFSNARISESSVTQHQSALSIAESQIPDGLILARVASNETISGNWSFTNPVVGQSPTSSSHLATKAYVDNVAQGLTAKASAAVATTTNIILSGLQTIDSIATTAGMRVLVKDQTNATQNGVYTASSGAWVRAEDMDGTPAHDISPGSTVFVERGDENGGTTWVIINTTPITLGTTPIIWSLLSRIGGLSVSGGLVLSGNDIAVASSSSTRIVVNANSIDLATTGVSAGTYVTTAVDAYGRVTSGTTTQSWSTIVDRPTTLSGYGITDSQPLDADLTALGQLSTTGLVVRSGAGTAVTRSLAVSGTGLSITNATGVSGNPTISSNATNTNTASTIVARDASGNFSAGTITASLVGNASTATSWASSRTLTVTGDVDGTVSGINGTSDIAITLILDEVNSNVGTFGAANTIPVLTVNAKGLVTGVSTQALSTSNVAEGANLYFTTARARSSISTSGTGLSYNSSTGVISSNATNANTASTVVARDASGNFSAGTITAALVGNASTATTLQTGRTFSVNGDATGTSVAFDGSTNISIPVTLANSGVSSGSYGSATHVGTFSVDSKGRITTASSTPIQITESQITDGSLLARNAGNETITGTWAFNNAITVGAPTSAGHATTKEYVDSVAQGLQSKPSARVATTGNLAATYNNGVSGVGATLTFAGALPTIDGITLQVGDGVLVKNQALSFQNGRYNVTLLNPGVLTRCGLCDQANEIPGAYVFITSGTQANTGWVQGVSNPATFVVGTDAILVTQFSGAGAYTGGAGLTLDGNTFNVNTASSARIVVNADNIDLATTGVAASTYRSVSVDAYGRVTAGTNPTTLSGYGITDAQPLDAELTAISALTTNGLVARTSASTAASRSIAVSGTGLSVTNADGVSGNPTISSNATNANTASTLVARDASGNFSAGTITAALVGNASTATTLQTARTINGVSFNGSANITVTADANTLTGTTLASNVVASSLTSVGTLTSLDVTGTVTAGGFSGALTGNASTATTLQTARTINGTSFNGSANITTSSWGTARTVTIGSTGKSVNGNANVSWSLAEIGAAATSHVHDAADITTGVLANARTTGTSANTANTLVLRDASGNFSAGTITAALTGNASTATTLQTARTINGTSFDGSANITTSSWGTARTVTIGSSGKSINGGANVSWTLAEIGAVAQSAVGAANGVASLDANGLVPASQLPSYVDDVLEFASLGVFPATGETGKIYIALNTGRVYRWSGSAYLEIIASPGTTDAIVEGSTNLYFTTARARSSISTSGTGLSYNSSTGVISSNATNANTASTVVARDASGNFSAGTITAALVGNASTATTLQTARTINGTSFNGSANITTSSWGTARTVTIGSTGKSVDGGANVSWTLAEIGAAATSHVHDAANITTGVLANARTTGTNANTANTLVLRDASGNFSAGTITAALAGNASTATTLQTARMINGVSFNGSANITVAAAAGTLTGNTLASGVTASSLTSVGTLTSLNVSGNAKVGGYVQKSVNVGISAAGTTQGTATALSREINVVGTVAANSGVLLPNSTGTSFIVINAGANALRVYPTSGAAIDTQGANVAFILSPGAKIMFIQVSATQYYTLNATYA